MKEKLNLDPKNLLTPEQLSKRYGIPEKTLSNWRSAKRGPDYIKVEGYIFYPLDKLEQFMLRNYYKSAS